MPLSLPAKKIIVYIGSSAILCAVYYGTAIVGLGFDAVSGFATLIWPPTGIALAALFLLGRRYWPAVALGAFAANYVTGAPLLVAAGIALGNTGEAVLGAYLLKRAGFRPAMDRLTDAMTFIVQAALVSTLVSPTVGVISLYLGDVIEAKAIVETWTAWWVGDILGALVIGSLMIVLAGARLKQPTRQRVGEAAALALALSVTAILSFLNPFQEWTGNLPVVYMVFIPLLWAALRFGQAGAVVSTFAVSIIAVWGTVQSSGPFSGGQLSERLLFLQLFTGIVAATTMLVAAVNLERKRAEEEALGFNRELEKKVADRTWQLTKAVKELAYANDIHDKRRAVLESVLSSIGEGVVAYESSGTPIVINPTALKILGLPPDQTTVPYERLAQAIPMHYPDGKTIVQFQDRPLARALRGEATVNERRYIKPAGSDHKVLLSVTASPILDDKDNIIGAVVVFREIPKA